MTTTLQEARFMKTYAGENMNRFYVMKQLDDHWYEAHWGRVGTKGRRKKFPMSEWEAKYNERVNKKRYKDITALQSVSSNGHTPEADARLENIMRALVDASQTYVRSTYDLQSFSAVTADQIKEAQRLIDEAQVYVTPTARIWRPINDKMDELRMVLPRKTGNLREKVITNLKEAQTILAEEQDLLDALSANVVTGSSSGVPVSESLGFTYTNRDDLISQMFGSEFITDYDGTKAGRVLSFWKIDSDQKDYLPGTNEKLFFHGSITKHWMSIKHKGLLIRPAGSSITGNEFGIGIYFSDMAMKSLNYTSLENSYWANGSESRGYLGIYKVNLGRQLILNSGDSNPVGSDRKMNKSRLNQYGFDTVGVQKGYRGNYNPEYIIYEPNRCVLVGFAEVGVVK